ncbi:MAG: hypothetical protein JKX84_09390 [Flavobacteriales bacterium]|nr:hypothetical protein [Flavobacteriales bacterium]
MKRTVRSEVGEFTIRENGLVVARTFPNAIITLQAAKDYHQMIAYLTHSQPHATVIDISGIVNIEDDAMDFLITQSSDWGKTIALGLIVNSFMAQRIAEYFLSENKPTYPVKVFKNIFDAQLWAKIEFLRSITRKAS